MKNSLLLPHRFKQIGLILLLLDMVLIFAVFPFYAPHLDMWSHRVFVLSHNVLFLVSLGMIALAKERVEDEYIASLRSQTFLFVVYACFGFFILWYLAYCIAWLSGITEPSNYSFMFQSLADIFNRTSLAVFAYVVVFNFRLWRMRRREKCEELIEK